MNIKNNDGAVIKPKSKFVLGALILTITSVISKILGAFYKVPLMHMIGSNGLGIFQLIFPIYSFFLVLVSGGISLGISKLISSEKQNNNGKYIRSIIKHSLVLILLLSLAFSLILILVSVPLSKIQGDNLLFICYLALVPALIFSSLISVLKGYFQGNENMMPSGLSMIIEQMVKLCAGLFLCKIFISKGIVYAVFGAFLGISLSELFAFVYLAIKYLFSKKRISVKQEKLSFKKCAKLVFNVSLPIMLNNIIMPLVYAVESAVTIWLLSRATIGSTTAQSLFGLEDGIVGSLINLPTVISSAIATALLPSMTKSFNDNNMADSRTKSHLALSITWLISLPCFLAFLIFSKDIVLFLYGNGLKNTAFDELLVVVDLVKISSLNIVYVSLLSVVTAILQAINRSYVPVKNLLISAIIKLTLTFVLVAIPSINIYGLVISDTICFALALILDVIEMKKHLHISFDFNNFVLKPLFCSSIMIATIAILKFVLNDLINFKILIVSTFSIGIIVYFALMLLTKTITKEEIFKLRKTKKSD